MSAPTITTAFAQVPSSTEKTALTTALASVETAISDARADGAFSTLTEAQLKSENVALAASIAANMIDHS